MARRSWSMDELARHSWQPARGNSSRGAVRPDAHPRTWWFRVRSGRRRRSSGWNPGLRLEARAIRPLARRRGGSRWVDDSGCGAGMRSGCPPACSPVARHPGPACGMALPVVQRRHCSPCVSLRLGYCIGVQINPESAAGPILTRDCSPHSRSTLCFSTVGGGADR
jgi:hypothetical protein